jgi:hypothetical protein
MVRQKDSFLEIVGSSMALISNTKNLLKIIVLAFFTSSIFVPVINILGIPLWLSIERGLYDLYTSTNSKDEFIEKFYNASLMDFIKKYFALFLGFSIGQAIWFLLFSIPFMIIVSGTCSICISILLLILSLEFVLYFVFLFNAIGYLFNIDCGDEDDDIVKICLIKGFKANFNISYLFKYPPFKIAKLFLILVLLNFIFFNVSIILITSAVALSLLFSVAYNPSIFEIIYILFTLFFSIMIPFLVIPFFIHLNIFYTASKMGKN